MEHGLAQQMVYGSGESQSTKHSYSGTIPNKTQKKAPKPCKKRKKVAK